MAKPAHLSSTGTEWDRDAALTTARILLEIKAINFRRRSRTPSPRAGNRRSISIAGGSSISPARGRRSATWRSRRSTAMSATRSIEAVAGGETAGIPFAAWIADRMAAPMAYVRKKPKGFGRNALIEGDVPEGKRTLLVEDLTTDGQSKIRFANALRDAGAIVNHAFVVFFYGVFPARSRPWRGWTSPCTICAPGGMCWRPARTGHLRRTRPGGSSPLPGKSGRLVGCPWRHSPRPRRRWRARRRRRANP